MPTSHDTEPLLAQFIASMPYAYRVLHDDTLAATHAQIAARRGKSSVRVESFEGPGASPALRWLCVVTDDRHGLLSLIASVILAHSLDIVSARAYCRDRPGGPPEAIDFVAVRALQPQEGSIDLDTRSIERSIEALLNGETDLEQLAHHAAPTSPPPTAKRSVESQVYFASDHEDLLIVESADRSGLLLAMTLAMLRERLTIQSSNVSTSGLVVRDEFHLTEFDGSRLSSERRRLIARRLTELLTSL